jgi:hypothetical protein
MRMRRLAHLALDTPPSAPIVCAPLTQHAHMNQLKHAVLVAIWVVAISDAP